MYVCVCVCPFELETDSRYSANTISVVCHWRKPQLLNFNFLQPVTKTGRANVTESGEQDQTHVLQKPEIIRVATPC